MIKITEAGLDLGLDLFQATETCQNSHNCLWSKRSNLFKIAALLPKNCPKEKCEVVVFRKTLESDSPAFYAEALKLSRFAEVAKTYAAIAFKKREANKKKVRRLTGRAYNLRVFGQLLVLAIYPLLLETKEIPFLKTAEIQALNDNFTGFEMRQTIENMYEINRDWVEWLEIIRKNLRSSHENYHLAAIYLVYLFLRGMEKNQLPDLKAMPDEEKEKFISEITRNILKGKNKKTD